MKRREFVKNGFGALGATVVGMAVAGAPAVHAQKTIQWKMVTTWPPKMPYLQDAAELLAKKINVMSGERLNIKVYSAGELVPAMQAFDAVSEGGTVQAASSMPAYWAGKASAAQWFAAVPFGLNTLGMDAWTRFGGGQALWEETYAPFNIIPRSAGNTGTQMAGWFNKKIETIDDFKGLKMRIPGLGGKVVASAGGTVVLVPGGEIFTSLERGVIDATEWVGPLHDMTLGFYRVAKYYYYPGWHEPSSQAEFLFNKQAYEKLPADLKAVVDAACAQVAAWTTSGFNAGNGSALETLIRTHKVKVLRIPDPVLAKLKVFAKQGIAEIAAKDPMSKKVHESYMAFTKIVGTWGEISEKAYYNALADQFPLT
jgi:TRAP-type mannitol/chloroaromatic compound transport system substrate-binding protein